MKRYPICLSLICLLLTLGMVACEKGKTTTSGTSDPKNTSPEELSPSSAVKKEVFEDAFGNGWSPSILLTRKGSIKVYPKPEINSTPVGTLPLNASLTFRDERTEQVTEIVAGRERKGEWLSIRSTEPEIEGWILASNDPETGNVEWIAGMPEVERADRESNVLVPVSFWPSTEIEQLLDLQGLFPEEYGYSGYYSLNYEEAPTETIEGSFYLVAQNEYALRNDRIVITGSYDRDGWGNEHFVETRIQGEKKEVLTLEYLRRGANCEGRTLKIFENDQLVQEYKDTQCTFDHETFAGS